jgi:hypothetical protein
MEHRGSLVSGSLITSGGVDGAQREPRLWITHQVDWLYGVIITGVMGSENKEEEVDWLYGVIIAGVMGSENKEEEVDWLYGVIIAGVMFMF